MKRYTVVQLINKTEEHFIKIILSAGSRGEGIRYPYSERHNYGDDKGGSL